MEENYQPYGKEWELTMLELSKKELVNLIRKIQTGAEDHKAAGINTIEEAKSFVVDAVNKYDAGAANRAEFMGLLGEYTARLMRLFWDNAKKEIIKNPSLLNQ